MSATPGPKRPQGPEQQFTRPRPDAPASPYAGHPAWSALAQSRSPLVLTSIVEDGHHRRHGRPARAAVTRSR